MPLLLKNISRDDIRKLRQLCPMQSTDIIDYFNTFEGSIEYTLWRGEDLFTRVIPYLCIYNGFSYAFGWLHAHPYDEPRREILGLSKKDYYSNGSYGMDKRKYIQFENTTEWDAQLVD